MSAVLDFGNDAFDGEFGGEFGSEFGGEFDAGSGTGGYPFALARPRRHLSAVPAPDADQVAAQRCKGHVETMTAGERSPLRLTARGRLVAALGVMVVAFALLLTAHLSQPAPSHQGASTTAAVVAVQPGDTLWSIAVRVAPTVDPRDTVEWLRRLNHLASVQLTPGQELLLR